MESRLYRDMVASWHATVMNVINIITAPPSPPQLLGDAKSPWRQDTKHPNIIWKEANWIPSNAPAQTGIPHLVIIVIRNPIKEYFSSLQVSVLVSCLTWFVVSFSENMSWIKWWVWRKKWRDFGATWDNRELCSGLNSHYLVSLAYSSYSSYLVWLNQALHENHQSHPSMWGK